MVCYIVGSGVVITCTPCCRQDWACVSLGTLLEGLVNARKLVQELTRICSVTGWLIGVILYMPIFRNFTQPYQLCLSLDMRLVTSDAPPLLFLRRLRFA